MKTIFSQGSERTDTDQQHSNFVAGLITTVAGTVSGVTEGACFGNAACQKNRAEQTEVAKLQAQAQLLNAQRANRPNWVLLGALVVGMAVAGLFIFIYLKKQSL